MIQNLIGHAPAVLPTLIGAAAGIILYRETRASWAIPGRRLVILAIGAWVAAIAIFGWLVIG